MNFEILDKINLIDTLSHAGLKMKPALYEIVNTNLVKNNRPTVIATGLTEEEAVEKLIILAKRFAAPSPHLSFREVLIGQGYRIDPISHQVTNKQGEIQASGTEQQIHEWAIESGIYDRYIEHLTSPEA